MSSNAEDEDCAFLEHVLDQLYDFGAPQKKKSKKKKRKRSDEEEKDLCSDIRDDGAAEGLQVDEAGHLGAADRQVKQAEAGVEVVTFQDPRRKPKSKETAAPSSPPETPTTEKKQNSRTEKLSLEKARLEVHRFGITGYKKEQQRVFERDRAVMLGARPPRKNYVNYKLLQEQIKEKKQKEREEVQPELKKKKKKRNQQDNKKKTPSGSGTAPSGQVGRFRDGMLILSSKEIQKIKGRRAAR